MCLLLLFINPSPSEGQYSVILASNRDEFYSRLSRSAHWLPEQPDVVCGTDEDPVGTKNGTWLGMNKKGRIGALLNILDEKMASRNASTRGGLVRDFLGGTACAEKYLNSLASASVTYNPFQLLLVEKKSDQWNAFCYHKLAQGSFRQLNPGFHCLGNNKYPEKPWRKNSCALSKFIQIVETFGLVSKKDRLKCELLDVLKNDSVLLPDSQLEQDAASRENDYVAALSAVFVKYPTYGTRAHTIILIDFKSEVEYAEISMDEKEVPISNNWSNIKWSEVSFEFQISDSIEDRIIC